MKLSTVLPPGNCIHKLHTNKIQPTDDMIFNKKQLTAIIQCVQYSIKKVNEIA